MVKTFVPQYILQLCSMVLNLDIFLTFFFFNAFAGCKTEGFADVYYIPSYGYAQSSYNPYDPSILIGSEASFTATNYQANPAQHFFVSSPVYIPVGNESSSVAVPICYQTPSWTNTGALPISKPDGEGKKFALPLTPMNIGAASEMVALKHVVSKPLQSSSDLSQAVTKLEIESDGKNTLDTQPPIGALTSDSIPTINQGADHLSNLKAPTAFRPAKADALANTGFTSYVSDLNLCSDGNRLRPRFQMNRDFTNMSLSLSPTKQGT
ncbi:hypothetical protein HPP92_010883 [Vanilla planifolia]|uniref:Uncharacterized protein n=1 Tax=Vanilla planifolia TaxID=51239 RepID=A0A835V196_VANPL|nr:hypothetical protein HPP92_010883 [Vanilla planifolia]